MRSDFLMALLICGTLIVALPPISDRMHNQDVKELLSNPEVHSAYLEGRMSTEYRASCYLLGVGMIATAVYSAASAGSRSRKQVPATMDTAAQGTADRRFAETVLTPPAGSVPQQV